VRSYKAAVTREVRLRSLWKDDRFWQPNFYDRVIRDQAELNRVREYISHNPIAWQFDRENPDHLTDDEYIRLWGWLENAASMP
jgi:hypothetical protein